MKTIGEIIREKRLDMGLTQFELAEQLGVCQTTIAGYEINRFVPNVLIAADMADIFECSLDELCGRKYEVY